MDTNHISIEKLRRKNIDEAVEVFAQAFYNNPLPMQAFGKLSSQKRLARVRRIYRGAVESALLSGHVYIVRRKGVIAGAAIAYSPDSKVMPLARNAIHTATVFLSGVRAAFVYGQHSRHVAKLIPNDPHWRLYFVGVAPNYQREGIGKALVRHFNRLADKDGVPSYLVTAREDHVPFYSAQGYNVTNVSAVPRVEDAVVRVMKRDVSQ